MLANSLESGSSSPAWSSSTAFFADALVGIGLFSYAPGQRSNPGLRRRPVRFGHGDPPSGAQLGMCYSQLVRRRANVHPGIVKNEILDMDEFASDPHAGSRVEEMPALDKAVADRAASHDLVQARELVFRPRHSRQKALQRQFPDFVSHWK
jgi:hypothetical protein